MRHCLFFLWNFFHMSAHSKAGKIDCTCTTLYSRTWVNQIHIWHFYSFHKTWWTQKLFSRSYKSPHFDKFFMKIPSFFVLLHSGYFRHVQFRLDVLFFFGIWKILSLKTPKRVEVYYKIRIMHTSILITTPAFHLCIWVIPFTCFGRFTNIYLFWPFSCAIIFWNCNVSGEITFPIYNKVLILRGMTHIYHTYKYTNLMNS